ncbi:hypothetical protein MNV49_000563 [Pseudohyphozyma bogoriensis]|nr:hypothetical protein MNV49_000563 [Pseudohyphozyma bogoriensis]
MSSSATPSTSAPAQPGVVSLPARPKSDGTAKPVWSLSEGPATQGGPDAVPLGAKCDVHQRERTVCCRDLKGEDERNLVDPDIVRDIIMQAFLPCECAAGLTVPFALTAGLSSLGSSRLVTVAGVAELVSGAISMGVGGYLSAQADRDHYRYHRKATRERVLRSCSGELERETASILSPLGVDDSLSRRIAGALLQVEATLPPPTAPPSIFKQCLNKIARRPKFSSFGDDEERRALLAKAEEEEEDKGLTAFLLKFGEGLEEVSDVRLFVSAVTIGGSYFVGGLVPLLPYFFIESAQTALYVSIAITTVVLLLFGLWKTFFTGAAIGVYGYTYGAVSTLLVGGTAAAASFGIVRALEGGGL